MAMGVEQEKKNQSVDGHELGMQRSTLTLMAMFAVMLSLTVGGCSSGTKVTRVDPNIVTDLSGRWNDTDSQEVAKAMIKEALSYP